MPTETLLRHREYDRETSPGRVRHIWTNSPPALLRRAYRRLIMLYGQHDNRAYLGEGNHRLAAAKCLGISHVPVRVYRVGETRGRGARVPGVEPNEHGYVKGDMKPSEIGLPTVPPKKR